LVSSAEGIGKTLKLRWQALRLPILAALTFGAYFVLMHAASREATFWPLVSARTAGVVAMLIYMLVTHQPGTPPRNAWHLAALGGGLDVTANIMYVLAGQIGRLDVAAVLGSLYPGPTILLAWLVLKEKLNRPQLMGVFLALVAIVLIAM
jgi:drug/metabolite transporter (DMT)-like permease